MTDKMFENLNKIPVRTKTWLNVNDISIKNLYSPVITPFKNVKVSHEGVEGVTVKRLLKGEVFPVNKNFKYGVGDELIAQGETEFNHGYLIDVGRKVKCEEPIIIEYEFNEDNNTLVDNFIIMAHENSKATIIIKYVSKDNTFGYHNGVCKIYGSDNSEINIIKVNFLNDNTVNFDSNVADIQYGAKVNYTSVDLGGRFSVINYHGDLLGDTSESTLNSIYMGDKNKIIDMNYIMTHRGRRSNSDINVKGALLGESKKAFKGTLDFKKGATKSTGNEDEYCMLLSPKSQAKAVPLLLCEEDDVVGQHAASAGKIDDDKLFYLMSRGLSTDEAKKLIIEAALNPIINIITVEEIRDAILSKIQRRLINEV